LAHMEAVTARHWRMIFAVGRFIPVLCHRIVTSSRQ